ncbi:MAG: DUF3892 domain-containing protein [Hyphomicrobiaceae bacterium]
MANAQKYNILFVHKVDRFDPHQRITHVGGLIGNSSWEKTQEQAIREIELGISEFYVIVGWRKVRVIIGISPYGNKYIRTEADALNCNNLLSLPEFPYLVA